VINVCSVERRAERLSNMTLCSKVVDFIRLYSLDGSPDRLVLRELQRDSLDGLR
jgi:hypothetical protein